jgi:hypothetical protein
VVAAGDEGLSAHVSALPSAAGLPEAASLPPPSLSETQASSGAGGSWGESTSSSGVDCRTSDELPQSDFVIMSFVNETAETLYLASTNSHCGAWPAFVEFSQNGAALDLYGGDCVPYCSQFDYLDYQSATELVADCAGPIPCPTPVRVMAPGQTIYQSVFPWQGIHHTLPGSCARGATEPQVECITTRNLPSGSYALRATAYRALDCGNASCNCNPDPGPGGCNDPTMTQSPRGSGEALQAEAVLQLGSPAGAATFTFGG